MQILDNLYWRIYAAIMKKAAEEEGLNTIEIVVILGILVALAILFGDKLMELFNSWWEKIATSR